MRLRQNQGLTCILTMRLRHETMENGTAFQNACAEPHAQYCPALCGRAPRPHGRDCLSLPTPSGGFAQSSNPTSRVDGLVVELCSPSELRTVGLRVSTWFIICPMNSNMKNVEIIKREEELIDKQISSIPTEHARGVTLLFGMPGEGFPRANRNRLVLSVCTRRCKAPIREGSILLRS